MKVTKQRLRELIKEECVAIEEEEYEESLLKEAEGNLDLFVMNTTIVYSKEINTTEMLNKIRAVEGVTRATPQGEAQPAGPNLLRHFIDIKFVNDRGSVQLYTNKLIKQLGQFPEIIRVRVMKITQVER